MKKQLIRYTLGGFLSYGIKIVLTYIAAEFFNVWYFAAYLTSLATVIIVNFIINARWIFPGGKPSVNCFFKYLFSVLIISLIDSIFVKTATEFLGLHYILSIIGVTTTLFVLKFFIYKRFVFV